MAVRRTPLVIDRKAHRAGLGCLTNGGFMARPEKDSCDFFFTSTKLLYDTKIKALRRSFKATSDANNAFFVFDYLFREIFGNEGYYIRYTDDLVGDTADFCYVPESFVSDVIQKCLEIGLFHKGQFKENGILTSRAIQKKYESITARRAKQKIEGRFYVLDEELMSTETGLMCAETGLMSTESTHSKRIEKNSKRIEKESKENGDSFSFGDDWNLLLEKWKTLEGSAVKAEPVPEWLTIPPMVTNDFLCRRNEYGIEKLLAAVDLLHNRPYWHSRKIGLARFLREETFLKLHDGGYEWNPDKPNNKPTKHPSDANERAKQRMREHHEQLRQNRDAG